MGPHADRTDDLSADAAARWALVGAALPALGRLQWRSDLPRLTLCATARRLLRLPADTTPDVGRLLGLVRRGRLASLRAEWQDHLAQRAACFQLDVPVVHDGGVQQHLRFVVAVDYADDGSTPAAIDASVQDHTDRQLLSERLQQAERRLVEAQDLARMGHWEWDFSRGRAVYSEQARVLLGLAPAATPDLYQFADVIPPPDRERIVADFMAAVAQRQPTFRYAYQQVEPDGRRRDFHGVVKVVYAQGGGARHLLGTIQDVTEMSAYRERLHALSYFDPLTQLPNRAMFLDRARLAMADAARDGRVLGVLMLGLDQFKHVNESLGHATGDELLKQAAARLTTALRDHDTVARPGGDEFAVLLPTVRAAADLDLIATKLLRAFESPFRLLNRDVFVTTSIGAALYPDDAADAEDLLQHADAALSEAKQRGRNTVRFYSPQLTAQASARLALESALRHAVERDELVLHFQPKVDLASRRIVGAEALMRWQRPDHGMVPPNDFIPLAEETGLIVPMGAWALETACRAAARLNAARGGAPVKVAVNLSARQFAGNQLVETVCAALAKTDCQPEWLELEITESLLIDKSSTVRDDLETLAVLGLSIALDDFGTGYSALSYLTHFPVHVLKIDRSFVKDLPANHQSAELARAIVSLGRSLGMTLVAEGVETESQARLLGSMGAHLAQGWQFGRPVPLEAFQAMLA